MSVALKVFVVDDHPIVRDGLRRLIERQPNLELVGEADDGRVATELAPRMRPDIIILDINLPGIDGIQTARLLRSLCPAARIIALTFHEEQSVMRELFENGVAGYVVKRASSDELLHAIRTVAGNGLYVDPRIAGGLVNDLLHLRPSGNGSRGPALTDREAKVLKRIAQGHSNKEIAAELNVSIKTVETYKSRAMEKLGLRDRVDIVRYAVSAGWLR